MEATGQQRKITWGKSLWQDLRSACPQWVFTWPKWAIHLICFLLLNTSVGFNDIQMKELPNKREGAILGCHLLVGAMLSRMDIWKSDMDQLGQMQNERSLEIMAGEGLTLVSSFAKEGHLSNKAPECKMKHISQWGKKYKREEIVFTTRGIVIRTTFRAKKRQGHHLLTANKVESLNISNYMHEGLESYQMASPTDPRSTTMSVAEKKSRNLTHLPLDRGSNLSRNK